MTSKDELRKELIANCHYLASSYKTLAAKQLLNYLLPLIDKSTNIAIYHAHGHEISLNYVVEYCQQLPNKKLYQPYASKNNRYMYFEHYNDQKSNIFVADDEYFDNATYLQWYKLDLIILPLVAVDKSGVRLGRGGGYYDFTLKDCVDSLVRPILCGVGYQLQLLDSKQLLADNWDVKLDYFASENGLLMFGGDEAG